ncbi:MAG TPA: PHP domain-containing protein [Aggregatilineales bacterium]|nr:PHP domain-containing protein [Anaerolineae bacterium]HUN09124.1 PHP domain-containing protein [Aggregatilineales bacterium]
MNTSLQNLRLPADAPIDLQTHTIWSDGDWTPEALIQHFAREGFGLAAITDHDRPDTAAALQELAHAQGLPLLVAVEMTTTWRGQLVDLLGYGFHPEAPVLRALAQDVWHRQRENSRTVYHQLVQQGRVPAHDPAELETILQAPAAQQIQDLQKLIIRHAAPGIRISPGDLITAAGFEFATNPLADVVDAIHVAGGVALIAHPGRGGEFLSFTPALLDQLRREVPLDGLEAHYPRHTPEQVEQFLAYAQRHYLLVSAGSDSHRPAQPPIKYPAHLARRLLERLGVDIEG